MDAKTQQKLAATAKNRAVHAIKRRYFEEYQAEYKKTLRELMQSWYEEERHDAEQKQHDVTPCYDAKCSFNHPDGGPFPHPCDSPNEE